VPEPEESPVAVAAMLAAPEPTDEDLDRSEGWRRWLWPAIAAVSAIGFGIGAFDADGTTPTAVRLILIIAGFLLMVRAFDGELRRRGHPHGEAGFILSMAWLILLTAAAIFANVLPLSEGRNVAKTLHTTTRLSPDLLSNHPLGTDGEGLDLLAGIIYGARVSLVVSIGAVVLATLIGGFIGLLAGYYRGIVDKSVSIVTDALLAFPPIALLLAMVAVLQPSVLNVTIGLTVLVIPVYVRLVKANTLKFAEREFVTAARSLGARDRRIIVREIVPNLAPPVLSYGLLIVPVLIAAEATLSFLGLGIQRPNPTWGNLIAAGQTDFQTNPNLIFAPGVALFLTVFALNRVAARLRARWEDEGR